MWILFDIWRQPFWLLATWYKVCASLPLITGSEWVSLFVKCCNCSKFTLELRTANCDQTSVEKRNETSVWSVERWPHPLLPLGIEKKNKNAKFWPTLRSVGWRRVVPTQMRFPSQSGPLAEHVFSSRFTLVENVRVGKLKRAICSFTWVNFRDANVRQGFVGFVKGLIWTPEAGGTLFQLEKKKREKGHRLLWC